LRLAVGAPPSAEAGHDPFAKQKRRKMYAMFHENGHPDVSLSDWKTFCDQFSPFLFSDIIDRQAVKLPDWFLPLARGIAVPSDYLLNRAGYVPGKYRPRSWKPTGTHYYACSVGIGTAPAKLFVRRVDNQPFWTIELLSNTNKYAGWDKVLIFLFGSTPVFTRNYQSAMYLADWVFKDDRHLGLGWVDVCPQDVQAATAFAKQRSAYENLVKQSLLNRFSKV
jgi:hypothetical protein